uniref:CCHC-type domain-containing protein n=1 Tax=Tanacetum cinerariifolium TaxID=118510 RepID=A0A6L2LZU5_TANCI|nr:hypothetical protein [Tanacetum cinerariifolium]
MFVTLVKQSQELKTVSYHKLYDILKQHQHEVNEIRAEKIARVANPLALIAQQQPVYHPQNHPTHYNQNSSTRSQQAATRNRGKYIVNSPQPIYDQEPPMVDEDDETSKDKEIDKLMALISLSNVGYENQRNGTVAGARETVGSTVVQKSRIQCYNCKEFGHVAREYQKPKRAKDVAYHREKMLLCKQEEAGIQLNVEQADWKDDTDDDELEDQELEAHYITHPEQSEYVFDTYSIEQDAQNVIIDSLDISDDREEIDLNDDDNDLAKERELLASLIEKFKCEIDESKNHNILLETSNKVLVEKLKREIEVFKNKNKSLESSNNFLKEANNKLSETNDLLYADYKSSQPKLARRNSKEYASKMELECAKVRGDYKLFAHQETISTLSKQKEAQIKLYKTQEDKELEKVIELENKVNVLDNIVYKTGQLVQTINMLSNKCRTSFAKPEFLKKAKAANPRLYDIGCYNDNLALMLAPEYDEVIRLEKESRSKLSDLIKPFDYTKLNNLYDLFVPQREKSSKQCFFSEISRMSSLTSQLENQKTQFMNEIDRLSREYYYADHMNAILGVYTELDEVTNLQCDYLELLQKYEGGVEAAAGGNDRPQLTTEPPLHRAAATTPPHYHLLRHPSRHHHPTPPYSRCLHRHQHHRRTPAAKTAAPSHH